ncbi:MAG TPA: hypothetical protein PLV45_09460 [bacterium]|nr:hypothetical protein [bacterium]
METARCVEAIDDSHVDVGYCCFYDNDDNFEETGNGIVNVFDCIYSNPQFVNYATGDYHLIQDTVRNTYSAGSISSCVDAGKPHYFCEGTTSSTGERDSGRYDIGYHYLESDFVYNFPRFKADDGVSTDYLTEVAVYNPTQYTQKLTVACYDLDGDIQDLNGAQDGNLLEVYLPAGNTWYRTLVESCSPGDTECIEMPCTEGSLSVTSDGPLFGQYRIVEDDTTSGVNSWMFQMQRTDLADDDGGITTLSCDNWIGRFGGGTNTIETEIVIHNLGDAENYVYGSVYNTQGTPVPSDDFSALLDPRETRSFIFDASSTIDYGNLEVTADDPVTGELIYHCQNLSGYRRFSEGVIMVPSTLYSDMLTAPFVQIENYGTSYQNSFIALKNPNSSAVTVGISVFDDQGNSIYTPGTPTPTPVAIPAHGSWCLDSYSFPDWGCYSVEIDVAGSETLIGHHEVLLYNATNVDFSMAGCELDHHLAAPTRYCVPCCVNDTPVGGDYETTWIVIRNNNTASSVDVDLTINAFDGTPLDNTTVTVGARSLLAFTFGDSPALLDPGSEPRFVLTIESEDVISGWAERYRTDMYGDDMTYDANALHAW